MGLFDRLRGGMPSQTAEQRDRGWDAPRAKTYLTGTGRDFDGLEENDQPVKFHVPEPVRLALDELARYYDSNLSTIVRHILFVNLFGSYDLHARGERGNKTFMPYKAFLGDMDIRASRSDGGGPKPARPPGPDLGKNDNNIKVWLPQRMVDDIDALAREGDSKRSVYIREALIRHLFGRIQLPEDT